MKVTIAAVASVAWLAVFLAQARAGGEQAKTTVKISDLASKKTTLGFEATFTVTIKIVKGEDLRNHMVYTTNPNEDTVIPWITVTTSAADNDGTVTVTISAFIQTTVGGDWFISGSYRQSNGDTIGDSATLKVKGDDDR